LKIICRCKEISFIFALLFTTSNFCLKKKIRFLKNKFADVKKLVLSLHSFFERDFFLKKRLKVFSQKGCRLKKRLYFCSPILRDRKYKEIKVL